MNLRSERAAKIGLAFLGGGVIMGSLMAMTVPTTMMSRGTDTLGGGEKADYAAQFPQDDTGYATAVEPAGASWIPVSARAEPEWQDVVAYTPAYQAAGDHVSFETTAYSAEDRAGDVASGTSDDRLAQAAERPDASDAAGASAEAARLAAADVKAMEMASEDPRAADANAEADPGA